MFKVIKIERGTPKRKTTIHSVYIGVTGKVVARFTVKQQALKYISLWNLLTFQIPDSWKQSWGWFVEGGREVYVVEPEGDTV